MGHRNFTSNASKSMENHTKVNKSPQSYSLPETSLKTSERNSEQTDVLRLYQDSNRRSWSLNRSGVSLLCNVPIYFSVCLVFSWPHSFYSCRKEFAIDYWTEKHTNVHKSRTRQEITRKQQSFSERISNLHVGQPVFSLFASGIKLCINRQQTKDLCHKRPQCCTLQRCVCVCVCSCMCECAPDGNIPTKTGKEM